MLNRVEVLSAQGSLLNLPLGDLDNGLLIDEIEGLDPVKATLTSSSFAQQDGSEFQSSRREERVLVFKIILEPNWGIETPRDLRRRLYAYLMPKSKVDFTFYDDEQPYKISGVVESFETALFSSDPMVNISVTCFDPDFYDPEVQTFSGTTTTSDVEVPIDYDGSVETGILFTILPDVPMTSFTLYHRDPSGELRQLDYAGALAPGDELKIQTVSGSKFARVTKNEVESSVLFGVSPQSYWPELQYGQNMVRVYSSSAGVPYQIEYTRKFGGL